MYLNRMTSLAIIKDINMNRHHDFIKRAKAKHHNKFDYSITKYINNKTKISIICPMHGEYQQYPQVHLNGKGCPKCHLNTLRKTTEQFIKEASEIHDNKYDYSLTEYTGAFNKVIIICPVHGKFYQIANDHTNHRKGCLKCYLDNNNKNLEQFIKEANNIHHGKYDYSKVDYKTNMDKISITCPEHGIFFQRPYCHIIKKQGCPNCPVLISKPQQEIINYIKTIYNGEILINYKSIINPLEIDIYIPKHKLAIEYNGLFWHSYDVVETSKEKRRHLEKCEQCENNNINLFQIWEHHWFQKQNLIKSMINNKLQINHKVHARKCSLTKINFKQYEKFLNDNHLQGSAPNEIRYALMYGNEIISIMGFTRHKKFEWELGRFATLQNYNVVGGASKLFKSFIKEYDPKSIMSYANRDHSNGKMYKNLNFNCIGVTDPGYFYVKDSIVYSRQQFQKHKLKDKLEIFDSNLTESQNMFNNGYRRLWNSGNLKYVWIKN